MKLYYLNTPFFNIVAKTVQIFDIPWHKLFNATAEIISSNLSVNHSIIFLLIFNLSHHAQILLWQELLLSDQHMKITRYKSRQYESMVDVPTAPI